MSKGFERFSTIGAHGTMSQINLAMGRRGPTFAEPLENSIFIGMSYYKNEKIIWRDCEVSPTRYELDLETILDNLALEDVFWIHCNFVNDVGHSS